MHASKTKPRMRYARHFKRYTNVSVFIVVQFLFIFFWMHISDSFNTNLCFNVSMQDKAAEQIQISAEGWGHKISNHVTEGEERKWLIRISQELGCFMLCLG